MQGFLAWNDVKGDWGGLSLGPIWNRKEVAQEFGIRPRGRLIRVFLGGVVKALWPGQVWEEVPHGLPPLRGIAYQIYLIPSSEIPNRPAYRRNLEETKEIQKQFLKSQGEEFDVRKNPFEEGDNDRDPTNKAKGPLHDIGGPTSSSKTKMMKQSLKGLIMEIKET
ncbi:hypothetical protein CR513_04294, partial [Mucuna pruriens]